MFLKLNGVISLFFIFCSVYCKGLSVTQKVINYTSIISEQRTSELPIKQPTTLENIYFPDSKERLFLNNKLSNQSSVRENDTVTVDDETNNIVDATVTESSSVTINQQEGLQLAWDNEIPVEYNKTSLVTLPRQKLSEVELVNELKAFCELTCTENIKALHEKRSTHEDQYNNTTKQRKKIEYESCMTKCREVHMLDTTTQSTKDLESMDGNIQVITETSNEITEEITSHLNTIFAQPNSTETTTILTTPAMDVENTTKLDNNLTEAALNNILGNLSDKLYEDAPILIEDVRKNIGQLDEFLNSEEQVEIPGSFLDVLDQVASRIDLNGSQFDSIIKNNFAIVMADTRPDSPVRGLRVKATDSNNVITNSDLELINSELNKTDLNNENIEAVVYLPECVTNSPRRISFMVFGNERAFRSTDNSSKYVVNSKVISVNVKDLANFEKGEVVDIHMRPKLYDGKRACAYWHINEDRTGHWSSDGCNFIPATDNGSLDICRCDHLTHFAEVIVSGNQFSIQHENILEILSLIGCALSAFGLFMICLTAILFKSWRKDTANKIWIQLCFAILIVIICFLIIVFVKFDQFSLFCFITGVTLHYAVLASFCWMSVAAFLSYRKLVLVFKRDSSHKLLKASLFSWGAPCIIIGILLLVSPGSYAGRFYLQYQGEAFCYPSDLGLIFTIYLPVLIAVLINITLFCCIMRSIFASKKIQKHSKSNEALHRIFVSCLLMFLFGLPWLFGLLAYNIIAAYLFSLTATLQGFVLFLFFVIVNKKTRRLWFNKLGITQERVEKSSKVDSDKTRRLRRALTDEDDNHITINFSSVNTESSSPFLPRQETANEIDSITRPHMTEFLTFKPQLHRSEEG